MRENEFFLDLRMTIMTPEELEEAACNPVPVRLEHFNPSAVIPYGVTIEHICAAMNEFNDFIRMVNQRMYENGTTRFESILMPANFSSIVGEFMTAGIPKQCAGIVKNQYHNGHPDMIPTGRFPGNTIQYAHDGIEIKGSRYLKGWQGHNPENIWLMVFIFDSNRPVDVSQNIDPKPFRFLRVLGAQLEESDWKFAGRSETSRRTITATVKDSGYRKMMANWIYNAPGMPAI
jgi:hypothetical protein